MKKSRLIVLAVLVLAFALAGCGKKVQPPTEELQDAEAAKQAAVDSGADKYKTDKYLSAQEKIEAAKAKMARAKETGDQELYEEARQELVAAIAEFEAAKKQAEECNASKNKVQAELDALKQNLLAVKDEAEKYDSESYRVAQNKYVAAQELLYECDKHNQALAHIQDANSALTMAQDEIAQAKAEEMSMKSQAETYTVVKGDTLWDISDMKYTNPFMWPLIYWANKADINDPDLIFPGQKFKIKKNFADSEKSDAINMAKTRGPWSLTDGK